MLLIIVCTENPYYRLLTNSTIYAPLASIPVISIIVAIDSDGTVSQQNDIVTDSLILARTDDEDFIGVFKHDPTNYQLYYYMFPPLQRQNMGQYIIYTGIITITLPIHMLMCYIFFRSK